MKGFWLGKKLSEEHRRKLSESHRKTGYINSDGYKIHHSMGRLLKEHRMFVEKLLGRSLKKFEVVHHWDENKLNNTLENLAVFRNPAHSRLHHFVRRHGISIEKLKFSQSWLFNN